MGVIDTNRIRANVEAGLEVPDGLIHVLCDEIDRLRAASRCASIANEPPTGQPYPDGGDSDFPSFTAEQTEFLRRKYEGERR